MKVFCPNCGTENEGMPGGRLTCKACTASFEVPREGGVVTPPPPQVIAPPPPVVQPPPPSSPFPSGYVGPPPSGFGQGSGGGLASGTTNVLSIVSLVAGILCCLPFASTTAIVTGVIAQKQIDASNGAEKGREFALVGIIMGSLGIFLFILGLIFQALGKLR